MTAWPDNYPQYHNANSDACDNLDGPCACGAWHKSGEFELKSDGLHRDGKLVVRKRLPWDDRGWNPNTDLTY